MRVFGGIGGGCIVARGEGQRGHFLVFDSVRFYRLVYLKTPLQQLICVLTKSQCNRHVWIQLNKSWPSG